MDDAVGGLDICSHDGGFVDDDRTAILGDRDLSAVDSGDGHRHRSDKIAGHHSAWDHVVGQHRGQRLDISEKFSGGQPQRL